MSSHRHAHVRAAPAPCNPFRSGGCIPYEPATASFAGYCFCQGNDRAFILGFPEIAQGSICHYVADDGYRLYNWDRPGTLNCRKIVGPSSITYPSGCSGSVVGRGCKPNTDDCATIVSATCNGGTTYMASFPDGATAAYVCSITSGSMVCNIPQSGGGCFPADAKVRRVPMHLGPAGAKWACMGLPDVSRACATPLQGGTVQDMHVRVACPSNGGMPPST